MCDSMCALQAGRLLFAKNSNRPISETQLIEAHDRRPAGGVLATTYLEIPDAGAFAVVGARPNWIWGLEHGVNEHGVAIGNEEVWTIDDPAAEPPGLIGMDLVRLGLERAASADQAVDVMTSLIESWGQGGIANAADAEPYFSSFLVADPDQGWVIETSGRTWVAAPVGRGAAISNRLSIRTGWTRGSADVEPGADWDRWRDPDMWVGHADRRLATTERAVVQRSDQIEPRDLAAVLRDHGGEPGVHSNHGVQPLPGPELDPGTGDGFSVCFHLRGYQATTSSIIVEAQRSGGESLRAWVAAGSPCCSVFVPVFPAAPPEEMVDLALAHRFGALARHVEAHPDTLEVVRNRFTPLETDLWAEADAAIGTDAVADGRLVASFWTRVAATLGDLETALGLNED